MRILMTIILLGTFVMAPHVQAQHQNSGELYEHCSAQARQEKKPARDDTPGSIMETLAVESYCAGYISGVVDGYRIMTDLYPQTKFICLPQMGISNQGAINIFKEWFKKRPKEKEAPARSGVLSSLKEKYPCK